MRQIRIQSPLVHNTNKENSFDLVIKPSPSQLHIDICPSTNPTAMNLIKRGGIASERGTARHQTIKPVKNSINLPDIRSSQAHEIKIRSQEGSSRRPTNLQNLSVIEEEVLLRPVNNSALGATFNTMKKHSSCDYSTLE